MGKTDTSADNHNAIRCVLISTDDEEVGQRSSGLREQLGQKHVGRRDMYTFIYNGSLLRVIVVPGSFI